MKHFRSKQRDVRCLSDQAGRLFTCLILSLSLLGCAAQEPDQIAETAAIEGAYAFVNVSLVPMTHEGVEEGQTVLVSDGRIQQIGTVEDTEVPEGYQSIDGTDRFLAPGLADMHAHPMTQFDLDTYIAHGVTLIRAMWGEESLLELKRAAEAGEILAPRIVSGGRIVDGEPVIHYGTERVRNAAEAQEVVARHKAAGYDFIKVYSNLSLESFDAIAAAAKQEGIPFGGHIPTAVPSEHAMRMGMQTAEHLIGVSSETLAEGYEDIPARFQPTFVEYTTRLGKGEIRIEEVHDQEKLARLAEVAAETGMWTVPTLATLRGTGLSSAQVESEFASDQMQYVDYTVQEFWRLGFSFGAQLPPEYYDGMAHIFQNELNEVKAFHDAGARLLIGTDAPNPFAYVGSGVVDEMQHFVDAGMMPFEALGYATTAVGEFMQEVGETGVIAPGARADLVLIDANPLDDVEAYHSISGVMAAGRWLDRAALDALLAGLLAKNEAKAERFRDLPPWPTEGEEQVLVRAEFKRLIGGEEAGVERIAAVMSPDGTRANLAQVKGEDGQVTDIRVEYDAKSGLTGVSIQAHDNDGEATHLRLEYEEGGPVTLTGSLTDWLQQAQITAMQDGQTLELEAQRLLPSGELEEGSLSITRHPSEVIDGHFYYTGCNRHDVRFEGSSGVTEWQVWLGGGFYQGWPVRALGQDADGQEVEYVRVL